MGVRFASPINTTQSNTDFGVFIYDSSFSGTPTEITLAGEGFDLSYLNSSDEIFSPIKGSEVKVYLKVTDDTEGDTLLTWLTNDLLTSKEDKYQIVITRSSEVFWVGNVLHDLSGRQDASQPFDFVLSATDGLARLKDFQFTFATGNFDRYEYTR